MAIAFLRRQNGSFPVTRPGVCRDLCRNPAIPAGVCLSRRVSLYNRQEAADMAVSRMNAASAYRCVSLGIVWFYIGQGIDTVEVKSSSFLVIGTRSLSSANFRACRGVKSAAIAAAQRLLMAWRVVQRPFVQRALALYQQSHSEEPQGLGIPESAIPTGIAVYGRTCSRAEIQTVAVERLQGSDGLGRSR